jgi:2OG-Fe(II) oxygenase superfamily
VLGFVSSDSNRNNKNSSEYDEYLESHAEGLQTLRYNVSKAYTPHLDYFEVHGRPTFNSEGRGSNRFATILLYMSDLEPQQGGETVFVAAAPTGQTRQEQVDLDTAIRQLRASGMATQLQPGSWEEELAAKCRIRLTIRPQRGRAILFYSQLPNGQYDPYSNHGACPVLQGEKYAANLWIWNGPRPD